MSYRDWYVGMRVVFVGYPEAAASFHGKKLINRNEWLHRGEIRTVLAITMRERYRKSRWSGPSIYVGCDHPQYGRVWHHCSGFRPLENRVTDISMFTAMLAGAEEREPA